MSERGSINPHPMREFDVTATGKVMAAHGYDHMIIIAVKMGEDGGTTVLNVGIDGYNAQIAAGKAEAIKESVLEWGKSEEAVELDKEVAQVRKEMATGPEHDPDYGKRLITLDRMDPGSSAFRDRARDKSMRKKRK